MAVAVFLAFAAVALLLASVFYFASAIRAILLVLTCARDKIEEQETFPEFLERFRANVEKEIIDPPSKQAEDFEELFESGNGYCVPGGFSTKARRCLRNHVSGWPYSCLSTSPSLPRYISLYL